MPNSLDEIFNHLSSPLKFDYLSLPQVAILYLAIALPIVWMGTKSLNWLGPVRQNVCLSIRLVLLGLLVMILAGPRWNRTHRNVEVVVLRDISASVQNIPTPPNISLSSSIANFMTDAYARRPLQDDAMGAVHFAEHSQIDFLPGRPIQANGGIIDARIDGTDLASAINLGLACFTGDAMKRLVLISDGNATQGDTDSAASAASAARIPIDVIPLHYDVHHEIMVDRLIAPVSVRQGEPFAVDVIVRSTNAEPVSGKLMLANRDVPMDLDPDLPGVQTWRATTLKPGSNHIHLKLPAAQESGINEYRASFVADSTASDMLTGNNSAFAFTFVRGKGRILYVDHYPAGEGDPLAAAINSSGIGTAQLDRISVDGFPVRQVDLQSYDAVVLGNVPHGVAGLNAEQDQLLTQYVRDFGGGLVVIGGPEALGAGGWQGSELEKILPVSLDVPAQRIIYSGALVLVLDHSGSMAQPMSRDPAVSKQQSANESAILATRALLKGDLLGVIAFDAASTWEVPLAENRDPVWTIQKIRGISPAGGTAIGPALNQAVDALEKIDSSQAAIKRILLLTDGISEPYDYDRILRRLPAAHITLSTIAVGGDADRKLLSQLAAAGKGTMYATDDPHELSQVFIREARTLRRSLISEPAGGIRVSQLPGLQELFPTLAQFSMPDLNGMVLTSSRLEPSSQLLLSASNSYHDPLLAYRQAGLGHVAVFTSDVTRRWASAWTASPNFASFWSQLLRQVARPAFNPDFDVTTERDGDHTKIVVEAINQAQQRLNFFQFAGKVAGADGPSVTQNIKLTQTSPGRYEGSIETPNSDNYVSVIQYQGPQGQRGTLVAGISINGSPEFRDLHDNNALLTSLAVRTGGRIHPGLDANMTDLFAREGLTESSSSLPVWDLMLPMAMGILLLDVAARKIAWDRLSVHGVGLAFAGLVRDFTTVRKVEPGATLQSLKRARGAVINSIKISDAVLDRSPADGTDISETPRDGEMISESALPAAQPEDCSVDEMNRTANLLRAKKRARQQIKQKEEGKD
ncbi:MAG TPA: VWA domain-containing protein [Tepidisphaeraceae bacterium]|nr:VWA domain-containing protein [Tepidisphaeraceae bacterium]